MSKIAWITPGYPPDRGGVSDHSFAMVQELSALGHEVIVFNRLNHSGLAAILDELTRAQPELVVLSYVPLAYAPRTGGLSPELVLWAKRLRRRVRTHTLLLAHETNLPLGAHWERRELKLAALAGAQIAQFELLALLFDRVAFSNAATLAQWRPRIPRAAEKLRSIRICSNIPRTVTANPRAELTQGSYDVPRRSALFFGSGHESVLFEYVEAAFAELSAHDPELQLVVVGVDAAKLRRLRPSLSERGDRVRALGFLPAREVSLWLQTTDLVLAPFAEGISARKGTVMAAFAHGTPVLSTRGVHTLDDIAWDRIAALAPLDPRAFALLASRAFEDQAYRARLGAAAKAEYDANASAPVTAAQLLEHALG